MLDQYVIDGFTRKQSEDNILIRDAGQTYQIPLSVLGDTPYGPYLHDACIFSQLCAEIYYNESDAKQQEKIKGCAHKGGLQDWLERVKADGWEKLHWTAPALNTPLAYTIKTLKYQLWVDRERRRAVVVFRGTAEKVDWWSNANWLTRFVPFVNNHYKQVLAMVDPTLKVLEKELGSGFKLYTTGHSLGGGLAQTFAYASEHKAALVAAFHSSPVTGWFSLPQSRKATAGNDLKIARIYEHKEILAGFRSLAKVAYPETAENPRIVEFRSNFMVGGGAVHQHSVGCFANSYFAKLQRLANKITTEPVTS